MEHAFYTYDLFYTWYENKRNSIYFFFLHKKIHNPFFIQILFHIYIEATSI